MSRPELASGIRAVVLHPCERSGGRNGRGPASRLEEAVGLAAAIDLEVVASEIVPVGKIHAGSFFGRGAAERLGALVAALGADVVSVDAAPVLVLIGACDPIRLPLTLACPFAA